MSRVTWRRWLPLWLRPAAPRRGRSYRPALEFLEERTTPATHVWSGATSSLMSLDANWSAGGHPANGENGPIVLVFPSTVATFNVNDDIANLNVDQIQFTGAAKNYVISGAANGVTLNLTGAAANQPNIDDQVGGNTFSATNLTVALAANAVVNVTTGALTVSSPITGPGGLTKVGAGTIVLSGPNTFGGTTVVNQGILSARSNQALGATGSSAAQTVTVTGTAGTFTLTFNGQTTAALAFNVAASGMQSALNALPTIGGVGGSVTVTQAGNVYTVTFGGSLAGFNQPSLTAAGTGGASAVVATVSAGGGGTVVAGGASLALQGGITITGEPLILQGAGAAGAGALDNAGGNNTYGGPITLGSNTSIGVDAAGDTLDIKQPIGASSSGLGVTKVGAGRLELDGTSTYTGVTTIQNGDLQVDGAIGNVSLAGGNLSGTGTVGTISDPAFAFNSGNPDGLMAVGSRPPATSANEIEAGDDFVLNSATQLTGATFTGLLPTGSPLGSIGEVVVEIYRVFPLDSTNPPDGRVPTRVNSPADNALDSRDSALGALTFTDTILASSFTAANSVLNGINAVPNQTTGGEGPVTGEEVQFQTSFATPFALAAGHYFFVPQVKLATGNFLWLSAPKPIVAPGTPFTPDLQAWIRNANLDPDWLRIGTDIVGGATPPTFNMSFAITGQAGQASTVNPGDNGAASPVGTLHSQTVTWGPSNTFFVDLIHSSAGNPVAGKDNDLLSVTGDVFLGGAALAGSVASSVHASDKFTVIQTAGGTIHGLFSSGASVFLGGRKFTIDLSDPTKLVIQQVLTNTTTTVSSSANPSVFGQPVVFTATVTPEAGAGTIPTTDTVTFTLDGVTYPAVPLSSTGQATFNPQTATGGPLSITTSTTLHTLHVAFSGDSAFSPSAADLSPAQAVNLLVIGTQTVSYRQNTFTAFVPSGGTNNVNIAGSMAFFFQRDLGLSLAAGGLLQNSAGMNEKWLQGNVNAFGNPWYFIKPSGQLYAWDGTPAAQGSTLIGTLDPAYYSYPDLIYNATRDTLDLVLRQRLGLTFTGNFFQNSGGQNEKWLQGIVNQYGNPWYFIDTIGRFSAWNGVANQANGTLLATLDTLYWAEPQRLYNAQPNEVTASLANNMLQISKVALWAGRVVGELNLTTPVVNHQFFTLSFVNHAPVLTVTSTANQATAPGQSVIFTVSASDADNDTLTFAPVGGHLGYVLEQTLGLRLQDSLFTNNGGQHEEWLQSTLNNWYFIKPNGQLFLWDGTAGQASGTLEDTLDPIYYYHPDLLYNAPGDLASALHQRLGLTGTTADYSQNYGGLNERWLLGADGWYFIRTNGELWKWNGTLTEASGTLAPTQTSGTVDPANGTLMATLDPLYYTDPLLLANAQPNLVTVSQTATTLTVTPAAGYVGDFWVAASASDPSQTVFTPPVRVISRTNTITLWETTGAVSPYTFAAAGPRLTARLPDPLGPGNADIVTAAHEFYDVFWSNADGTFNAQGQFLTVEAEFAFAFPPYGGGLNIAQIDLNHVDGTSIHATTVTSFVALGNNAIAGSQVNAVDGNLQTWSTMGNTIGQSQRLRITVGFPAITLNLGSGATINENDTFSRAASFTATGSAFTATVDYGDGTGTQPLALGADKSFSLSHVYPKPGAYTVTVKVDGGQGDTGTGTLAVTVNNLPPRVGAISGPTSANTGQSVSFTAPFTDPGPKDTHTAVWNWGDGTTTVPDITAGTVTEANGAGATAGSHTYTANGTFTVTVTVTDDGGLSASSTSTVTVGSLM